MMGRCMAMHGNVHIFRFVVISWCIKTRWQCTGSGVHRWFSPLSGSSPHGSLWGTRSGIAMNGTNLVCLESQLWCLKVQSQEIRSGLGSQVPTKTKWNGSGMVSKTPKKILQMTQMTGTRVSFVGSWNTTRETNNSNETNDSNECFILVLLVKIQTTSMDISRRSPGMGLYHNLQRGWPREGRGRRGQVGFKVGLCGSHKDGAYGVGKCWK